MSANNFEPLTTGRFTYSSTSQSIQPGLFFDSWKAQGSSGYWRTASDEYTKCMPTGENAFFHMLLDASGSTWQRVKTGEKKRVYKHLLSQFSSVVTSQGTFRPNDMIYVWSFNLRTKLLWKGEQKNFQKNMDFIRAEYKKELDGTTNYKETRLYDAVGMVMETIHETHKAHRKAYFFLVPFTDGIDNKSEEFTLNDMMESINSLVGRLHTYFITVNMPPTSDLFMRLEGQQNDITHINCQNTKPDEISRAFNTLRECIKAFLLLVYSSAGANVNEMHLTRIADYGRSRHEVADRMMMLLSRKMHNTSLMEGWNSLGTLGPARSSRHEVASNDARGSGQGMSFELRSKDLPSKRLLGKGLASIGYETELGGVRFARKDFVGVPIGIFKKEAVKLVCLKDHKNVVKTYGLTVDKMSCSLVLEYMDDDLLSLLRKRKESKGSLVCTDSGNQSELSRSRPLELPEVLGVMLQIARGMESLHEQGILHGDLKTKNILVTYMNDGDKNLLSVKVADFGLVRTKRKSTSFVSRQARKHDMVRWTAPENLEMLLSEDKDESSSESDSNSDEECTGSSGVTDRLLLSADVYGFALTCFQILTGEDPYPNLNWKDLGTKIVSGELRPELPAACPPPLRNLLVSCWGKAPAQRPTFSHIRTELELLHTPQKSMESMELVKAEKPISQVSEALKVIEDYSRLRSQEMAAKREAGAQVIPPIQRIVEYGESNEAIGDSMLAKYNLASGSSEPSSLLQNRVVF